MWLRNGSTKIGPWAIWFQSPAFTPYFFQLLVIKIIKHLLFTGLEFMKLLAVILQNCLDHMNGINKRGSDRIRQPATVGTSKENYLANKENKMKP